MSDLAIRTDDGLAPAAKAGPPNPLKMLPPEWRAPVSFFYAVYSDTLKGTTGLVARFRLWMKDDGLTLAEAKAVMKRLMRPARAGEIQFPGQLMAALADEVVEELRTRRMRARQIERQREQAEIDAHRGEPRRRIFPLAGEGSHAV